MDPQGKEIKIGISSCLLGQRVRYDGGHKQHSYIENTLGRFFEFVPFCPEMEIGMGVPREPVRLVRDGESLRCIGVRNPELDVTEKLTACADGQRSWHETLCGYILKKDSPSCGMERVKVYRNDQPERNGSGLYASGLMSNFPDLPVEEEGRLGDPLLRENFIRRVFVLYRWKLLQAQGLSISGLTRFHAQHKLIIMSHNQNAVRSLGNLLARLDQKDLETVAKKYLHELMTTLKITATRQNHTNVLQHIQGYLNKELDKQDKAELAETIDNYRKGLLPLIVPVTLLRHHFRRNPDRYIEESFYMMPHPAELSLLNGI
ncbi:MAG: DUF523 and DUF1722 domain-containing protein [Gammaproteobacteria bacterium]|nr:DUF523 and DUF1722 domain-containing protein [Gammaproteobacteria bacterium]